MTSQLEPPYIRTEFKLEAVFKHRAGGETLFKDIVGMSASFALNTIPTAALEVATGLEVHDETRATIHDFIDKLEPRDRCLVYLELKSTDGYLEAPVINGMRDGKFIVFDGYYAGIGYHRGNNHCTYTIHLIHWLDDLNCSSMLNGDWSQGTPHDLTQAASQIVVSDLTGGGGSNASNPSDLRRAGSGVRGIPLIDNRYPAPGDESIIVTQTNMEKDLWEKVIKRIFEAICCMRHPRLQCPKPPKAATDPPPTPPKDGKEGENILKPEPNNEAAWQALKRMPGDVPDKYKAKLPLNLTGFSGGEPFAYLSLSAHDGLSRMIMDGMGYNTFWSKLTGELAPSFLFAISPCVDFAQAIPFFPGLHTPYVTITGEEYNYANFNTNCAHMISSIIIYWSPQGDGSQAHMGGYLAPIHGYCKPAGMYPVKEEDHKHHWGNIMVRDPPAWLANPVYTMGYTRENHFYYPGRSTAAPQKGHQPNPEAKDAHREAENTYLNGSNDQVDDQNLNIYDRFACQWYKSAILGQRYGEISGKLRFDIAPGSIVKIEPPVSAIGKENTPMYAAVVGVSFAINAEQHQAGTSFTLSHVRTERENDINIPASKTHYVGTVPPIYKKEPPGSPWPGGPLIIGQEPQE